MQEQLSKNPLIFITQDQDVSNFTEDTTQTDIVNVNQKEEKTPILPLIGALIFVVVYVSPFWDTHPMAHSCLAVLCCVAFLWGTEAIPAYAAAYVVPLLGVWLGLGYDESTGKRISASKLASTYTYKFMDPIIFVFLGSMTMSSALTKLKIIDRVSHFVFKKMSTNPRYILLTIMLFNWLIAAFLSNVASTTIILSFATPIIRSLDPDDPFIKAVLFGIAWSGNAGGMPTTIASPQNILALKYIHDHTETRISFVKWMYFGVPSSLLIIFAEWIYLMWKYQPQRSSIVIGDKEAKYTEWTVNHTLVSVTTVVTIALWALNETFNSFLGNVGISSCIPIIIFFGGEILSIEDFHSIKWSTLSLMGGGLALGEAMSSSGLLDIISDASSVLSGIGLWPLLVIFLFLEGVLASLLNSTSAANILYPLIYIMGESTHHPCLLVALSSLMVSGAQLFHISSFPNALVSGVCRHKPGTGEELTSVPFLKGKEYFLAGWPTLIMSLVIISTVGYFIARTML